MDRIVHESVLTNTSDEKVNALMYQATLKAYIEKAEKKGGFVELDTVKLIIGVKEHESL